MTFPTTKFENKGHRRASKKHIYCMWGKANVPIFIFSTFTIYRKTVIQLQGHMEDIDLMVTGTENVAHITAQACVTKVMNFLGSIKAPWLVGWL